MGFLDVVLGPVMGIVDKLIPDPQKKAEMQLELLKAQQAGDFKVLDTLMAEAKGQTDTNIEEAKSDNLFKSGWRPAVGWVCVSALFLQFVIRTLLPWIVAVFGLNVPPMPSLDIGDLMTLLMGMLGLGGLRTYEKFKGVA